MDTGDKWYQLFQKGVELGTWNVEKLFDEIGFEQDRETWESLEADERNQIRYLLSGFLDGENGGRWRCRDEPLAGHGCVLSGW